MNAFISACLSRNRTVLSILLLTLISGLGAYISIPIEATPDVKIPMLYIMTTHRGISPRDAETQLLRPLEHHLKNIEGVKEMRATAFDGGAYIILEFHAGFNADKARQDVREKVDLAQAEFPLDTDKPSVNEINLGLMPILIVKLSGHLPQRALYNIARNLKDAVEAQVPSVLKAELVGNREEVVEIIVDPMRLESAGVSTGQLVGFFHRNHMMVPAGALRGERGEFAVKVPGLFETVPEIMSMPILANGEATVCLRDVAEVRRTFKDASSIARDQGVPAVSLEISKRTGENIIETIEAVQAIVKEAQKSWPQHLTVAYSQDQSQGIRDMLLDLQNNIISAILLVMIVIVASLGWRSALLVGVAVPGSFLAGVLVLKLLGLTMNIVVLFSLILSVGMLVDGAIIVVEYADRRMAEGLDRVQAYLEGAQRMAWPVITSITTILVVFLPLLFWPGVVGQFMKYLPITLLATLSASLVMALVFIPALGQLFGKPKAAHGSDEAMAVALAESGDLNKLSGFTGGYVRFLGRCLDTPGRVLLGAAALLIAVKLMHGWMGKGVEFFPNVEPETATVLIRARGNLAIQEQDKLVRVAEKIVLGVPHYFKSVYTRVGKSNSDEVSEDTIGRIILEFADWKKRPKVEEILPELEREFKNIPGVVIEIAKEKAGPPIGKPVQIQLSSAIPDDLNAAVLKVRNFFEQKSGLTQIEDTRPVPGIEWRVEVDRAQAAKFGVDVGAIGDIVQFVTAGLYVASYRPDDSPDEVDIYARFPSDYRSLDELKRCRVPTPHGLVPITNFVKIVPKLQVSKINRINAKRAFLVKADVLPGEVVDRHVQDVRVWLEQNPLPNSVELMFKGEDKEQQETGMFLMSAFLLAIALIAIILVTQFNSFFSMALVLSAVVMSTIGVMVGLLITGKPFGIVMGGIGVIALAGIIVSNNIILIDTYDLLKHQFTDVREAILRTGAQRLRPVILTKLTTILGLLPIMFSLTLDFINFDITYGAPSTQWWVQLSSTIVFGVLFASVLTLIVTPCALMMRENYARRKLSMAR